MHNLVPYRRYSLWTRHFSGPLLLLLLALASLGTIATAMLGCAASRAISSTPPDIHAITVTGTSGTLQHSTTVTLLVQ